MNTHPNDEKPYSEEEKRAARIKVREAVKYGRLVRPLECNRCKKIPPRARDGRSCIHGHHHDYGKPLDVEWICAKCHRDETPLPEVMGAPNYGEKNGFSKLTEDGVRKARAIRNETGISYQRIAAMFGVDKKTIMRACKFEQWKQIAAAPSADG